MSKRNPPKLKKFPAGKQRRMDELLRQNSEGALPPPEQSKLAELVAEAERLMVANAKLLAQFKANEAKEPPPRAVPVTVWVHPELAEQ